MTHLERTRLCVFAPSAHDTDPDRYIGMELPRLE